MGDADIASHVRALRDCNQRGGRMLSLVDLIKAGTLDLAMGAYLAAVMRGGGSLLVGAQPGGAGKTAVMVALLNFLPDDTVIQPIEGPVVLRRGLADTGYGKTCYLAHEIGEGYYYAYIWGEEARMFFQLAARGHIIASNLHTDTLSEMRAQLCGGLGANPEHLRRVTLKVFLRTARGPDFRLRRWVSRVYESDGEADRLVWTGQRPRLFVREAESAVVSRDAEERCHEMLETLQAWGIKTVEDVRRAIVEER